MSISLFNDKERPPTYQEINDALGSQQPLWQQLIQFIADNYQIPADLSFGGKKYGWNLWYRKSGKTLLSLYPQKEYFVVQIVLGRDQVERASQLRLGENVKTIFENTPQLHDGRWLFIHVRGRTDVDDIQKLVQVKKKLRPEGK